jgi:hypothetical protein
MQYLSQTHQTRLKVKNLLSLLAIFISIIRGIGWVFKSSFESAYAPIVRSKLTMINLSRFRSRHPHSLEKFRVRFERLESEPIIKLSAQRRRNHAGSILR